MGALNGYEGVLLRELEGNWDPLIGPNDSTGLNHVKSSEGGLDGTTSSPFLPGH